MSNKEDVLKFLNALAQINTLGLDPDSLTIPYDEDCPITRGSKIIKTKMDQGGDEHLTGSTGITIGGLMVAEVGDCYIIKWDNSQYKHIDGNVTFCQGSKISDKL